MFQVSKDCSVEMIVRSFDGPESTIVAIKIEIVLNNDTRNSKLWESLLFDG